MSSTDSKKQVASLKQKLHVAAMCFSTYSVQVNCM